jgi:hypothetical protein
VCRVRLCCHHEPKGCKRALGTIFRAELVVAVFLIGPLLDVDADPPAEPSGVGHAYDDQVAVVSRGQLRNVGSQVSCYDFRPGVLDSCCVV